MTSIILVYWTYATVQPIVLAGVLTSRFFTRLKNEMNAAGSEIQEQLMAVSSWPSDLSALRQTPKEIERNLRSTTTFILVAMCPVGLEDFLVDRHAALCFTGDEYSKLCAIIG